MDSAIARFVPLRADWGAKNLRTRAAKSRAAVDVDLRVDRMREFA
jgi:hypothetical protein